MSNLAVLIVSKFNVNCILKICRFDERPDLKVVKEKVEQLVRRDAHQLFLRLEAGVREFVLEIKLKLAELLQKQAKSATLAQDFIQCK